MKMEISTTTHFLLFHTYEKTGNEHFLNAVPTDDFRFNKRIPNKAPTIKYLILAFFAQFALIDTAGV
jgi:hypothetical protein